MELILMNHALPDLDGPEAPRRFLRASKTVHAVSIIALSSHAFDGDSGLTFGASCDESLPTPIDETLRIARIEEHSGTVLGRHAGGADCLR